MVQVRYKGQNFIYINGYKIKAGVNEIKDDDFYEMMRTKTFKFRVEQKILEVEPGFPLEKPTDIKKSADSPAPSKHEHEHEVEDAEEKEEDHGGRLSVKATLKLIDKSDDEEYLQNLIDNDGRHKVVEDAKKKLKSLK